MLPVLSERIAADVLKTGIELGKCSAEIFIISWFPKPARGSAQKQSLVDAPGQLGFPGLTFSIFQILIRMQNHPGRNGPVPLHKGGTGSRLPTHRSGKGDEV